MLFRRNGRAEQVLCWKLTTRIPPTTHFPLAQRQSLLGSWVGPRSLAPSPLVKKDQVKRTLTDTSSLTPLTPHPPSKPLMSFRRNLKTEQASLEAGYPHPAYTTH
jgi:hypothetical protein